MDPRLERAIEQFDLFQFLDNYQIDYQMDGKNIGQGYVGISPCPSCGDNKYHYGIHIEKKFGTCFKCKTYTKLVNFISYYGGMTFKQAKEYLLENIDEELDINERVKEILNYTPKRDSFKKNFKLEELPPCRKINSFVVNRNKILKEFLDKRKLTLNDCKEYDLRIHKDKIIFPIYYKNKIMAHQWRSILYKKYHLSSNATKFLYREENIHSNIPLILVEGFFDFTTIDKFIRKFFPNQIAVTTGFIKSISQEQINTLTHKRPYKLIVMFDRDSWFDYWRLKNTVPFDVDFVILPSNKDPNELTELELHSIFRKDIFKSRYVKWNLQKKGNSQI